MTRSFFPLFRKHLDLAHQYWSRLIHSGDQVVDATCGNGHDTLFLLQCVGQRGRVWAIDIQDQALQETQLRASSSKLEGHLFLHKGCHSTFPDALSPHSCRLVVYNLGYLPGTDKALKTQVETTLKSLTSALPLLCLGGALSITCYSGHSGGKEEEEEVLRWASSLNEKEWSVCLHRFIQRSHAPCLLLIQRRSTGDVEAL